MSPTLLQINQVSVNTKGTFKDVYFVYFASKITVFLHGASLLRSVPISFQYNESRQGNPTETGPSSACTSLRVLLC